jgi:hypothetical protein
MTRRTTLTADRDDLALLESEARKRGVSLAQVLHDLVAREAEALRQERRPRFGLFDSGTGGASERASEDEESPARGTLRS